MKLYFVFYFSPIFYAVTKNNLEIVKILLSKKNCDVNKYYYTYTKKYEQV